MRVWQVMMVAAVVVAVTEAQRFRRPPQVNIPSRAELTVAINNIDTVKKALACIEGKQCQLDEEYHVMLQSELYRAVFESIFRNTSALHLHCFKRPLFK